MHYSPVWGSASEYAVCKVNKTSCGCVGCCGEEICKWIVFFYEVIYKGFAHSLQRCIQVTERGKGLLRVKINVELSQGCDGRSLCIIPSV